MSEFDETREPSDDELEAEFLSLLEDHLPSKGRRTVGELVDATVVAIVDDAVLVNYGAREEAPVPISEFLDPKGEMTIKPGDSLRLVIEGYDEGSPQLSYTAARAEEARRMVEQAYAAKVPIRGRVSRVVKGGLILDVGIPTFMPGSQVDRFRVENLDALIGQEFEAYVIEYNADRDRAVVSRRALLDERAKRSRDQLMTSTKPGDILKGRVRDVLDFGVFVEFDGVDGLIPRSELSYDPSANPASVVSKGQEIEVKVLEMTPETGRLTLSRKKLQRDPWETIQDEFPVGSTVRGQVTGVQPFGAFVQLSEGITGLIHVKDVSWDGASIQAEDQFKAGDEVTCQVVEIDTERKRLALSLKHLSRDPWLDVEGKFPVGTRHKGTVMQLRPFGAFVKIGDGAEGLVHVSDMSWEKRINDPSEIVSEGEEVEVMVLRLDNEKRRIGLGIKQLSNSPFHDFLADHPVGSVVSGKVKRFVGFGAFIELKPGLEGLLHVSQIAGHRIESPEKALRMGEDIQVKILDIDENRQRISLSRKAAVEEAEERNIQDYMNKAKEEEDKIGGGGLLGEALQAAMKKKK